MSVFPDLVAHPAQGRSRTVRSEKGRRGEVTSSGISHSTNIIAPNVDQPWLLALAPRAPLSTVGWETRQREQSSQVST